MKSNNKNSYQNILFLLTQDLESPSGIGRYYPLCKNLVGENRGVTIAALHSDFHKLEKRRFIKDGVKVAYVSQMHVKKEGSKTEYFGSLKLIWISFLATWKLLVFAVKSKANVIVIGKPHPMNSIAGIIGGRLTRAKIILDSDDYEAMSNYFSSDWQKWVVKIFENTIPKLVDHITTNTIYNKQRMINSGIPSKKIEYLPNGVDQERFEIINDKKTNQLKSTHGLINQNIVAYIGSVNLANHAVDLMIEAMKIILEKRNDVSLLIVGGGKDLKKLKDLSRKLQINDKVIFVGRVKPDEVPYYYQMADITIDPVHDTEEAKGRCPLKMFESWAMNTPFITADVGDRKILAGSDLSTLLAEPGNPDDLANKIMEIINNPILATKLRETGKQRVKKFYWDNLVTNHLEMFVKY